MYLTQIFCTCSWRDGHVNMWCLTCENYFTGTVLILCSGILVCFFLYRFTSNVDRGVNTLQMSFTYRKAGLQLCFLRSYVHLKNTVFISAVFPETAFVTRLSEVPKVLKISNQPWGHSSQILFQISYVFIVTEDKIGVQGPSSGHNYSWKKCVILRVHSHTDVLTNFCWRVGKRWAKSGYTELSWCKLGNAHVRWVCHQILHMLEYFRRLIQRTCNRQQEMTSTYLCFP